MLKYLSCSLCDYDSPISKSNYSATTQRKSNAGLPKELNSIALMLFLCYEQYFCLFEWFFYCWCLLNNEKKETKEHKIATQNKCVDPHWHDKLIKDNRWWQAAGYDELFFKIVVVCDETRKIINFLLNACIHDFDWYIYARHVCLFTLHYVYLSVIDEFYTSFFWWDKFGDQIDFFEDRNFVYIYVGVGRCMFSFHYNNFFNKKM